MIRVDLKLKTENKQVRNLKFGDKIWTPYSQADVISHIAKQATNFGKLKLHGIYTQAASLVLQSKL